jgi:hypothetical protein
MQLSSKFQNYYYLKQVYHLLALELILLLILPDEIEFNDRGKSAALTMRHPLSAKVATKFRQQVAVAQSI